MKRRDFFYWVGASSLIGLIFGKYESTEEKIRRLIDKANNDPEAWMIYPTLPEIITATHPEALHLEVIDDEGEVMGAVRMINTKTKLAEQYRRRVPTPSEYEKADRTGIPVQSIAVNDLYEPIIDTVPYARLRMKDGRDVMEVFRI
jgi:hypothetical protein